MSRYKFKVGEEFDSLTQDELVSALDDHTKSWYQEKARGLTSAEIHAFQTVAGAAVSIPANGEGKIGPQPGYAWGVTRLFAGANLGTGDVIKVYKNAATDASQVLQLTAAVPLVLLGTDKLILRGEDSLIFVGAGLTATGTISINGEAVEVAELDFYKLID